MFNNLETRQFPRKMSIIKVDATERLNIPVNTKERNRVNNLQFFSAALPSPENKPDMAKITKSSKNR